MAKINGGVAAGHRLSAEAAAMALKDGGTAVDATIAGLWTACVCEPVLASPGGAGFMTVCTGGKGRCLDFFADTPHRRPPGAIDAREILADFGTTTQAFTIGAGTSAVPGMGPGLFEAHEHHGRLPMAVLLEPAIDAARSGFVITGFQASLFRVVSAILTATAEGRALYANNGADRTAGEGCVFRNSDMGDALEEIAREGVAAIREGEIARAILIAQADGGTLDHKSLRNYRPVWREPVCLDTRGWRLFLNPPPSAGGTLIARMLQAPREGHEADHANAQAGVDDVWRATGRDIGRFAGHSTGRLNAERGTTHISVIDAEGMAVSATVSNGEGNGTIVPGCGFMLNNMLGEDDVNPAGTTDWEPGERLSSMMAPTIARTESGDLLALGSGGSSRIRSAIFQVLTRHVYNDEPIADAIGAPRCHVENGHLDFEDDGAGERREALTRAFPDHRAWKEPNLYFGGVHAVRRSASGGIEGAGDQRRDGVFILA